MKIVIGLVGEKGSGKETFGKFLKELLPNKKIAHIRFSDLLGKTLDDWDLPRTRENLQKLAVVLKNGFGSNIVARGTQKFIKNIKNDLVIIDGVRWESDAEFIRSFPQNKLVYITSDLMIRFERIKQRSEKTFEEGTTFEQFMKEEKAENELYISQIGKRADFKIINNTTFNDFKIEVKKFYQKFLS